MALKSEVLLGFWSLLGAKSSFSLGPTSCRAPAADFQPGASKTCVLRCLGPRAIKNVVFSCVKDVLAPMGRLVMCLGRLGHQKLSKRVPKASLLMSFFDICFVKTVILSVLVRRSRFLRFCVVFWRVRPSIRSRRRSRNAVFHFRCGL